MSKMANADTVEYLREIAHYYQILDGASNPHRAIAYNKAASTISKLDYRVETEEQARSLRGIGASIGQAIEMFVLYNSKVKLDDLKSQLHQSFPVINLFLGIYGVGIVKAWNLYNAGYLTIEDIPDEELTPAQRIGREYYIELNTRMPRETVSLMYERINQSISDYVEHIDLVGSYRRGASSSGDIDILLVPKNTGVGLKDVVQKLTDEGLLLHNLALGKTKYAGVTANPVRRIDIRLVERDQYPCALMYFTGSKDFNVYTRVRAKSMYMKLSEYYLTYEYDDTHASVRDEEDIFAALDMEYIDPIDRNLAPAN